MKLLAISGSLRAGAYNTRLLLAVAGLAPEGAEFELLDAELLRAVPPFDADLEAARPSAAAEEIKAAIAAADAVLFATPEYNGSIPGQLKNALDWVSRPFDHNPLRNKPVAVVSASQGMFGAVWASADLRRVLGILGARVLDRDTPIGLAATAFDEDGLVGPESAEAVRATLADLAALVREREALRVAA